MHFVTLKTTQKMLWVTMAMLLVLCSSIKLQPAWSAEPQLLYLGQKIPPLDHPWSSGDYAALIAALNIIEKTQVNALPRRDGDFTGPIYDRMISPENFKPQLNIYLPLELRQNQAREMLFQLKELMKLYFDFKARIQPYGVEALGLMNYSLQQQAILFTLTTEFWTTLAKDERQQPLRLKGLMEAKQGAAILCMSALDYLSLSDQFNQEDLEQYSAELVNHTPPLYVHLPQEARVALLNKIHALSQQITNPTIADNLKSMLNALVALQHALEQSMVAGAAASAIPAQSLDFSLPKDQRPKLPEKKQPERAPIQFKTELPSQRSMPTQTPERIP